MRYSAFMLTFVVGLAMLPSMKWAGVFDHSTTGFQISTVAIGLLASLVSGWMLGNIVATTNTHRTLLRKAEGLESNVGNGTAVEKMERFLTAAYTRAEILSVASQRRADLLYWIGSMFLAASILGPVASFVVYANSEPLSPVSIGALETLNAALGGSGTSPPALTVQTTLVNQPDWRVLLGGVTFGFLLLAAGGGLLKQRSREIEIYFRTVKLVNHYRRLLSVLTLRAAVLEQSDADLAEFVIESLSDPDPLHESMSAEADGESDKSAKAIDEILSVIKATSA
ncbi:MAG: hypothetical protein ABJZ55_02115 [Fuerstiella sp.]